MNRLMFAKTPGTAPGEYYPPYFNVSDVDGKVILHVRCEQLKAPRADGSYAGQEVSFELDFDDMHKLHRELMAAVSRRCGDA